MYNEGDITRPGDLFDPRSGRFSQLVRKMTYLISRPAIPDIMAEETVVLTPLLKVVSNPLFEQFVFCFAFVYFMHVCVCLPCSFVIKIDQHLFHKHGHPTILLEFISNLQWRMVPCQYSYTLCIQQKHLRSLRNLAFVWYLSIWITQTLLTLINLYSRDLMSNNGFYPYKFWDRKPNIILRYYTPKSLVNNWICYLL